MSKSKLSGRRRRTFLRCAGLILAAVALSLVLSFQHVFQLVEEHNEAHVARDLHDHPYVMSHKVGTEPLEVRQNAAAAAVSSGGAVTFASDSFSPSKHRRYGRLQHEEMFTNTLKSCLPAQKGKACKTYMPESTERIGIIAPPGSMTTSLLRLIEFVVAHSKKADGSKVTNTTFEIIPTTHMPPYGYGKTHGYTRLIRVVPEPLLVGATDTLVGVLDELSENGGAKQVVTLNDIKASLRQQIRYQCRLNHISAHTALWTIGLEEVAEMRTKDLVVMIQEFFNLEHDDTIADQFLVNGSNLDDENSIAKLETMFAKGALLLSVAQSKTSPGTNILQLLDEVLLEEMRISKNLTAWPCESFWTVGEREAPLELSPMVRRISQDMSPNCTAPLTDCFVQRDKCEYNGDGKCAKQ